jgi:hypothetical protein
MRRTQRARTQKLGLLYFQHSNRGITLGVEGAMLRHSSGRLQKKNCHEIIGKMEKECGRQQHGCGAAVKEIE